VDTIKLVLFMLMFMALSATITVSALLFTVKCMNIVW